MERKNPNLRFCRKRARAIVERVNSFVHNTNFRCDLYFFQDGNDAANKKPEKRP